MAELQFSSFTFLFTFLLFLFMLLKIVRGSKAKKSSRKLPPGPRGLPLIGNLHQLSALTHRSLRDLAKKYGPLMYLKIGEVPTIIVSSSEIAKEVMKTQDIIFAQRPSVFSVKIMSYDYLGIAFTPYGSYWRQLRKICTIELLSAKRVQSFQSIRADELSNLIKAIHSNQGSVINLTDKIFAMTYGITARAAFGNKCKDQDAFISIVIDLVDLASGFSIADLYPSIKVLQQITGIRRKVEKLHQDTDKILEDILNDHKQKKLMTKIGQAEAEEDLVDVFLRLQQDGELEFPITDDHIKAVILDIFIAGSETSSTTVEWTFSEMLKNPRVLKEAQAEVRRVFDDKGNVDGSGMHELKFLKAVVKETLRLHPPATLLIPRESRESCEINGYVIPEKTRIMVNAWAIGRDPNNWKDAETFYPERFLDSPIDFRGTDFEYIPFGAGRRMCPGITFALPNVEYPLAQLLYHFDWNLPNGMKFEDLDMTEHFGSAVSRKEDLLLIPTPYRRSIFHQCP
ncbi:Cytochrome P450 [Melia azedarach]|uniref:Cytochrome P450 n=2 Tax=Melia azedarach TaxID=155640 RepID=A0ACC1YPD2_MELAZ|nr:Cytochrome P450 [Melia azedarach]KAJ4725244.1 Cytochrome P450 [Melia azedarach]